MPTDIKRVGVVGAGAMGAQIAALAAGAGCDVELLDVVPGDLGPSEDSRSRDRLASSAVSRLLKMKPAPLYCGKDALRIRPGNIEDHIRRLSSCGWIIEAVVERADIKRRIYSLVSEEMSGDAILSSNTSGLLRKSLVEGLNRKTRERFLVTHFFNPPRYMKLLEVVSGDADPSAAQEVCRFAQGKLGKGVVYANDTPLFIANRIGVFYALDTIHRLVEEGWPIEAVDAVLSKPTARPKSGVFRTVDMAGVDILTFVAAELVKGCQNDPDIGRCRIPQFLQQMVVKGLVGDKSEGGFYRKDRLSGRILALDPNTLEYRPKVNFSTPSLVEASRIGDPAERLRRVVFADDQAGEIAWPVVSQTMIYAAMRIPEIADGPVPIDSAMRWGYNWELGPFETWDALGVPEVAKRLEREGRPVPPVVEALLKAGHTHFYEWRGHRRTVLDVAKNSHLPVAGADGVVSLKRLKAVGRLVERNAGASVVDAGDGVFVLEFHTKMNSIDADVVEMLGVALDRVESEGAGLLIANEGGNFSAGANLLLVLMAAQQKRWEELNTMVRVFQSANQRMRFFPKPVVAVPFGMTLGGGCEICLSCARCRAHIESYMGLVEIGAGLIPSGGGCKNAILAMEGRCAGGPQPKVSAAFELIVSARVSGSAREAFEMGLLSGEDRISMDRDTMLFGAKQDILALSKGYAPPAVRHDITLPGCGGEMALVNATRSFVASGKATEYDAFIAKKLARVLSGGDAPTIHEASEYHILDLEREAFLSLVGEEKTQARMAQLLKTGRPLRN